jgi:spore coat polysaccharide biosynthesis protein SpsF (cytidylyltransferase family)
MSKALAIIQARMGSSRLPGKVMHPVAGTPLLGILLQRLTACQSLAGLCVATTTLAKDDALAQYVSSLGVPVLRGDEADVLGRYWLAWQAMQAQLNLPADTPIVRLTADCPLMDPVAVDAVVTAFIANPCDYATNTAHAPRGLDVEVFTPAALHTAFTQASLPHQREHVTPFLYDPANGFALHYTQGPPLRHHRWTVDTPEDLAFITLGLEALWPNNPTFTQAHVLALLAQHPDWEQLNAHVVQKPLPVR